MTGDQQRQFRLFLNEQRAAGHPLWLHHGDCVGSDAEAHRIAQELAVAVVLHPPDDDRQRAFCTGAVSSHDPMPYLRRNRMIVDSCDVLVAAPKSQHEQIRSGTWATIRYARAKVKPIVMLLPVADRGN
jgi:hypothetical protein